jgi:hypothetical protein
VPFVDVTEAARQNRHAICSNPVAPTISRNEPFGENVKGLSYFRDKGCAVEAAVQTIRRKSGGFFSMDIASA